MNKFQRTHKIITRELIKSNPHILFIFGDNCERKGLGGQAKEFRGESNTYGIRVKRCPNNRPGSFFTDICYGYQSHLIDNDIQTIKNISKNYRQVWIPVRLGMGRANLPDKAPITFTFLTRELDKLTSCINS